MSAKPRCPSPSCYVHLSLAILPPPPVSANVTDSLPLCNPHLLGHSQVGPQAISIPKACTIGNNRWEKSERSNSGWWKHILPLFLYTTLRDTMDLKLRMTKNLWGEVQLEGREEQVDCNQPGNWVWAGLMGGLSGIVISSCVFLLPCSWHLSQGIKISLLRLTKLKEILFKEQWYQG